MSSLKKFGLDKMPYEVFTLKHNPEKTDPRYYETMLKKLDLKPESVFISNTIPMQSKALNQ